MGLPKVPPAVDRGNRGELPVVYEIFVNSALAMRDRGSPNPRDGEALRLILQAIAVIASEIAILKPREGVAQENVLRRLAETLAVIQFVRPGVGEGALESMGKPLVHLYGESIVEADHAVSILGHSAEVRVRPFAGNSADAE